MSKTATVRWSVYPRYSCGSPAQVDEATAMRVAHEERRGYETAADGTYGTERQQLALSMGLHGIVLCWTERRGLFDYRDALTGESRSGVRPEQFALDRVLELARRKEILEGGEVSDGD
jgi:hypothetical protein